MKKKSKKFENIYEISIKELTKSLNSFHNLKKKNRYWELIIGKWLSSIIYLYVNNPPTRTANKNISIKTYNDSIEFNRDFNSKKLNELIGILKKNQYIKINRIDESLLNQNNKSIFKYLIYKFLNYFDFRHNSIIFDTNINYKLKTVRYSAYEFLSLRNKKINNKKYDLKSREKIRQELVKRNYKNNLLNSLLTTCIYLIPKSYLENFEEYYEKYFIKTKKKKLISSHAHITDDEYKIYLANQIGKAKLVYLQHGAEYLIGNNLLHHKFEYNTPDTFYTYGGFGTSYIKNVKSFYIPKIKTTLQKNIKEHTIILKDFFDYEFGVDRIDFNTYLKNYRKIVSIIKNYSKVTIRLYGNLENIKKSKKGSNIDNKKILKAFDNKDRVNLTGSENNLLEIKNNILVFTYIGSAFLQAMANNIPSVLFLNKDLQIIYNDEFLRELKKFKNSFFFDDFKTFNNFVKSNHNHYDLWWKKKKKYVIKFQNLFCKPIDEKNFFYKLKN